MPDGTKMDVPVFDDMNIVELKSSNKGAKQVQQLKGSLITDSSLIRERLQAALRI